MYLHIICVLLSPSVSSLRGMKGVKRHRAGSMMNGKARSTWIAHYHPQSSGPVLLFTYFFNGYSSNRSWKHEIQTHQREVKRFKIGFVAYKINRQLRYMNWEQLLEGKNLCSDVKRDTSTAEQRTRMSWLWKNMLAVYLATFCHRSLGGFLAISVNEQRKND